jgi:hypothetical protein
MPSGYTDTLPDDLILDVGILTYEVATVETKLGVSRGGLTFESGTQYRNVEFDGKRAEIEGLDRIIGYDPHIKGKMLQWSTDSLPLLEPGSASVLATGVTTVTPAAASALIVAGSYLDNLTITWARRGGGYAKVIFPIAKVAKYSLAAQDKNEGEIDVDFVAMLGATAAATSTDTAPYIIKVKEPA